MPRENKAPRRDSGRFAYDGLERATVETLPGPIATRVLSTDPYRVAVEMDFGGDASDGRVEPPGNFDFRHAMIQIAEFARHFIAAHNIDAHQFRERGIGDHCDHCDH